jgi:hypothetical protein
VNKTHTHNYIIDVYVRYSSQSPPPKEKLISNFQLSGKKRKNLTVCAVCASVFFRFLLWVVGLDLVCCRSVRYLVSSEQPTGRIFFFLYLMPIGFLPFSTKTGWTGKKKNQIYDSISFFLMCTTTKYGEFHSELGERFRHLSDDHRRSRHFNNTSATMSCTKMKIQIKRLFTRFGGNVDD